MSRSAIADRFRRTCADRRGAIAVYQLAERTAVTFASLLDQFEHIRRALASLRLAEGECAICRVGNRAAFFPIMAAVLDAGAALLPMGEITDAELSALAAAAGAAIVITDRDLPFTADAVTLIEPLRAARARVDPARPYPPMTIVKLTSGSTDLPKAALAHESHLINDGRHIVTGMGIAADDVNLGSIPLSHSYALGNLVMPLILGGTPVALRPLFNPSSFDEDVKAAGVTVFPGVPFMFDHMRAAGFGTLPTSLRLLITAGARIDPATVTWFRETLDRKIHSFYGSSETGGIAFDASDDVRDPLDVGRPLPETSITIVEEGRVFVAGNAVVSGYATPPAGGRSPFRNGGFLTSDLGYVDAAGRLVLTGRASPLVNVAGLKVDPAEIERSLAGIPGVADARVLGVADSRRGEQLVAFVVRRNPSLDAIALRRQCAATLSPYKIPRQFIFLDRLPVDARGKTDRRALEALARSSAEPELGDPAGRI